MKIPFTFLFVFILTWGQAQKATLSLNLEQGKTYKQVMKTQISIVQDLGSQTMDIAMTITGDITYLVKEASPSEYRLEVQYEKLALTMQMPQANMEFDSEKADGDDIFSSVLGSMKHKPFWITMTKKGKITNVENIDTLFNTMFDKFSELSEAQRAQIKTQLMQSYGEKSFTGNIEMVTALFPEKPVSKGEKWITETTLESGMSLSVTTTYQLKEINSDHYVVSGDSKMVTKDKDKYVENNGMQMRYDMTGTMTSQIKVDKKSGWILESQIKQDMKGDVFIQESPQMPNGMKIPMTMTSEMTLTDK